jgi:prephenate dehydrogenase
MKEKINTVCIIGVGLIGGSLAKSLRAQSWCDHILGIDKNIQSLHEAKQLGLIDEGFDDVAQCKVVPELVVIAVPMKSIKAVLASIHAWFDHAQAITDVGSAKTSVLEDLQAQFNGQIPTNFVPGHPIAGREKNGVLAAVDDLFLDRKVLLTPTENTRAESIELVSAMWQQAGAEVEYMQAQTHDKILAATSHLPHALAYALVHCLSTQTHTPEIFRYAAGGFADFTRIASSDPEVWRDICLSNRDEILQALQAFDDTLKQLKTSLEKNDGDALQAMFAFAKKSRDQFHQ